MNFKREDVLYSINIKPEFLNNRFWLNLHAVKENGQETFFSKAFRKEEDAAKEIIKMIASICDNANHLTITEAVCLEKQ